MIVMFTDFGLAGPYLGQMEATLYRYAAGKPVINLMADAPRFNPAASAVLLAAMTGQFPADTVFLCVVDPGVGSASRRPVVVQADERWFVGPDNGLFDRVIAQSGTVHIWEIVWHPEHLSNTFHGRDLFAPVAARLATGSLEQDWLSQLPSPQGRDHGILAEVIYIDHYGNAMTGIPDEGVVGLQVKGERLDVAATFSDVATGQAFVYYNSLGLLEIAVNQGSAADTLALQPGDKVTVIYQQGQK